MTRYQAVSLSGGKDSTAMLLMMLERGERVDEVVVCDTGMEFPQMYEHLGKLEKYVGVPFTRLRSEHSFEWWMYEKERTTGDYAGKVRGYGWARSRARWCTAYLKTKVIDRHFRELAKDREVVQCVGIAADEAWRAKDKRYPLIEWGVTEAEELAYCRERGFDWGGLYDIFSRVSCWCCPLQPIGELRKLRRNFPDLWQRLLDMDDKAWNDFKIGNTARKLEERFALEDRQMRLELSDRGQL